MPFTLNNSREFTNYLSSNEVDTKLQKKYHVQDARSYKTFLQTNGLKVIEDIRRETIQKIQQNL